MHELITIRGRTAGSSAAPRVRSTPRSWTGWRTTAKTTSFGARMARASPSSTPSTPVRRSGRLAGALIAFEDVSAHKRLTGSLSAGKAGGGAATRTARAAQRTANRGRAQLRVRRHPRRERGAARPRVDALRSSDATVLIEGETGTGKRADGASSARARRTHRTPGHGRLRRDLAGAVRASCSDTKRERSRARAHVALAASSRPRAAHVPGRDRGARPRSSRSCCAYYRSARARALARPRPYPSTCRWSPRPIATYVSEWRPVRFARPVPSAQYAHARAAAAARAQGGYPSARRQPSCTSKVGAWAAR